MIRFRVYSGELCEIPTNIFFYSVNEEKVQNENYPVEKIKDEKFLEKLRDDSNRIVTEAMGIEEEITRTYCAYMSEEYIDRVYVVVETETRDRFELWYVPSTMKFVKLSTYGKETYEENKLFDEGGPYADIYEIVEIK